MCDELHVLPVDDLITHTASDDCVCGPASEMVSGADGSARWLVTHHSLDGREHAERPRSAT